MLVAPALIENDTECRTCIENGPTCTGSIRGVDWRDMNEPSREYDINVQDPVGKVVGKRKLRDPFSYGMKLQETGSKILRSTGATFVPKGVFRFQTHEEADAWMTKILAHRKT